MSGLFQRLAGAAHDPGAVRNRPVAQYERTIDAAPADQGEGERSVGVFPGNGDARSALPMMNALTTGDPRTVIAATSTWRIGASVEDIGTRSSSPPREVDQERTISTHRPSHADNLTLPGSSTSIGHSSAPSVVPAPRVSTAVPLLAEVDVRSEGRPASALAHSSELEPRIGHIDRGRVELNDEGRVAKAPDQRVAIRPLPPADRPAPMTATGRDHRPQHVEPPIIEITIGRIEVRAPQAPQRKAPAAPFKPRLGLDEFTRSRNPERS